MKSTIRILLTVLTLSWMTSATSCASLAIATPPALELRTLRLSPDLAGFEYQYEICVKKFLGICTRREMKKEVYDLTNPETRKQLISMGFVARVREKL